MDERVIVDPVAGTILAGSVASKLGAGGEPRDGNVEVAVYSWLTGSTRQTVLHQNLEPDDHDVPSLLIRPDGRYLAVYTTHNVDRLTRWRVSLAPRDGTHWGAEQIFDWSKPPASIGENKVTYSNVFHLTLENRTYNFVRAINRDPSFLVSSDFGTNWKLGGKLLTDKNVGYVNAYVKYSSNDADRIDFIATEHHPKDFNRNINRRDYRGLTQGCA